jgi:hypothetical protein
LPAETGIAMLPPVSVEEVIFTELDLKIEALIPAKELFREDTTSVIGATGGLVT